MLCVGLGCVTGGAGVVEGTGAGRSVRRGVGRGRSALATVVGGVGLVGRGAAGALGAMAVSPMETADEADAASVRSRARAESTVAAVFLSPPHALSVTDRHTVATAIVRPVMRRTARPL